MKQNTVKVVKTKEEADKELTKEVGELEAKVEKLEGEAKDSVEALKVKDSEIEKLKLENKKLVDAQAKKGAK